MKGIFFFTLVLCYNIIIAQSINFGFWKLKSSYIVHNSDTAFLFRYDVSRNYFNLSNISYHFNTNEEYYGKSISGSNFIGNWNKPTIDSIYLDGIGGNFHFIDSSEFIISYPIQIQDTSGDITSATSFLRFYNIPIRDFKFNVSPNPFTSFIDVQIESPQAFRASIIVVDLLGKQVYSTKDKYYSSYCRFAINLSFLPKGIYFISIIHGKNIKTKKIIKI